MQRRLEARQQERQRLKQSEKTKAKISEQSGTHALKSWNHRKVSINRNINIPSCVWIC